MNKEKPAAAEVKEESTSANMPLKLDSTIQDSSARN